MRSIVAACAGTMLGLFALVSIVRADEEKIPLKDVPKAALDAVKAKFPGAELTGAEKETENGKTTYEVALKDKGQNVDVAVTAAGKILEIEKEIAAKDLPKAVSAALEAKYPKATIKKAEAITEFKEAGEEHAFEVVVVKTDKKSVEVKLSPQGKILEEESGDGN